MSPEWMIAIDRMQGAARQPERKSLCDPLEREEWRGLDWFGTLVARLLSRGTNRVAKTPRQVLADGPFAQRTALRRF